MQRKLTICYNNYFSFMINAIYIYNLEKSTYKFCISEMSLRIRAVSSVYLLIRAWSWSVSFSSVLSTLWRNERISPTLTEFQLLSASTTSNGDNNRFFSEIFYNKKWVLEVSSNLTIHKTPMFLWNYSYTSAIRLCPTSLSLLVITICSQKSFVFHLIYWVILSKLTAHTIFETEIEI